VDESTGDGQAAFLAVRGFVRVDFPEEPTPTIQRVGHPAAWIGARAVVRVVPMRCVESDTYTNFKDGPPALAGRAGHDK
jgi:hypothetical protein